MRKTLKIFLLLALIPIAGQAQFLGVAGQYTSKADGQFAASFSFPTIHPKNPLNLFVSSGLEYTTPGGAEMAGLNLKPVQLSWFVSEKLFNDNKFTILVNCDAGYLFDFRRGHKDAVVVTPNLYVDYKYFFLKTGYDFDVFNGRKQFFARVGLCVGLGTLKSFLDTQIW